MDTQVKKREWVKTAAIIFLSVLLVLTFFSNTILNASLPEVATQQVTSGTINAKIRGTGTVSANETYNVTLTQTRKIESVPVKVGQSVQAGDVLFVLEDAESDEVQTAKTELNTLEADYQKSLITASNDAATKNHNISKLKAAYEDAKADYDKVKAAYDTQLSGSDLEALKAEKKTAEATLVTLKADLQTVTDKYNDAASDSGGSSDDSAYYSNQIDNLKEDIDALEAAIAELKKDPSSETTKEKIYQEIHDKQDAKDDETAKIKATIAAGGSTFDKENEYYQAYQKLVGEEMAAYSTREPQLATKIKSNNSALTTEQATALAKNYIAAYKALGTYYEQQAEYDREIKLLQAELNAVTTGSLTELETKLADDQTKLKTLQAQQASSGSYSSSGLSSTAISLRSQKYALESKVTAQEQVISDLEERITEAEKDDQSLETAGQTMKTAKTAWEDAVFEASLGTTTSIDLQQAKENIALKQAALEKLEKNADANEITAKVGGTITTLNVKAGDNASADTPLAVISMVDRGFTVKISVTSQQASKIRVGDSADVVNYWDGDVEATVESIASDTQTKGNKLVTFRLTGEVQAEESITLSIGQKSASYDAIVPNSAIREDNNGKFVLAITSKATPLSTRYTATRVPVEVLASDDTMTAVSGIGAGEFVITTSTKPIEAGTEVRMAEKK